MLLPFLWRLAKVVDTYDRLIQAADRGQFTASDFVWEFRLARIRALPGKAAPLRMLPCGTPHTFFTVRWLILMNTYT